MVDNVPRMSLPVTDYNAGWWLQKELDPTRDSWTNSIWCGFLIQISFNTPIIAIKRHSIGPRVDWLCVVGCVWAPHKDKTDLSTRRRRRTISTTSAWIPFCCWRVFQFNKLSCRCSRPLVNYWSRHPELVDISLCGITINKEHHHRRRRRRVSLLDGADKSILSPFSFKLESHHHPGVSRWTTKAAVVLYGCDLHPSNEPARHTTDRNYQKQSRGVDQPGYPEWMWLIWSLLPLEQDFIKYANLRHREM